MMDVSFGDVSSGNPAYGAFSVAYRGFTGGQSISDAAVDYFEGILTNQKLPVNYVVYAGEPYVYMSGEGEKTGYDYCMAYGDISLSGTRFTGTGTVCTVRVDGYNEVSYAYEQVVDLDASVYNVRSNLGDYSGIICYDWSGLYLSVAVTLGGVVWFIRKLMRLEY